jgi:hypothetical protein
MLIAMPSARKHTAPSASGDDEEDLPEMVLGVTSVAYREK